MSNSKTAISTKDAPAAIGPYSQAVRIGNFLYTSGQVALDPATGAVVAGGVTEQTTRVIENLKRVLVGVGSGLDQVVVARVYLTHFERDYAAMNDAYRSYFAPGRLPARTCIGVTGLARGALVEIDLLARKSD